VIDVITLVSAAPGGLAAIAHLTAHPTNRRTIPTVAGRNRPQPPKNHQARMPATLVLKGEAQ